MSFHIRVIRLVVEVIDIDWQPRTRPATANLDRILIVCNSRGIVYLASEFLTVDTGRDCLQASVSNVDRWRSTQIMSVTQ